MTIAPMSRVAQGAWPKHLGSRRDFYARKRRELRALRRALAALATGSAYVPGTTMARCGKISAELDHVVKESRAWR